VKTFPHELFDGFGLDCQVVAKSVKTFNFASNHQFANLSLDSVGQPIEDQLFVDTGDYPLRAP
jgi:hypothetical protein